MHCMHHAVNRGVRGASEDSERGADADPTQRGRRELSGESRPAVRVLGFPHRLRLLRQVG